MFAAKIGQGSSIIIIFCAEFYKYGVMLPTFTYTSTHDSRYISYSLKFLPQNFTFITDSRHEWKLDHKKFIRKNVFEQQNHKIFTT